MVTATAQAKPQQRPRQQAPTDQQLAGAVIAALAGYYTAKAITAALRAPFKAAGISGAALSAVAALVSSWPHEPMEGTGPATRWAIRANLSRRAQFFIAAARRVQAAIVSARSQDQPVMQAIRDALTAEQKYMRQHVAASTQRIQAGSAVDGMAATYGNLLGWRAHLDERTSPGCRRADGKSFYANRPPIIEGAPAYPGSVHPHCRCSPGPPRPGAPILP
jgi:SPP1 gp7 family putative phage head morphogenesis protein